ncbi:MAG: RNA polymerase sigma factor [Planctomycetota bacterium]|jgi:RNA polymerase sigma-70 factor (ECF subfamily)
MDTKRGQDRRREFVDRLHEHQRVVRKISTVYANGRQEREDLFQEIVMQLWRSYPSFRGDSSFATWAYRVALNTALFRRRKASAHPSATALAAEGPDAPTVPAGPDPTETKEGVQLLYDCIHELRELDRAIVLLHLEGTAHAEIANISGLTVGNVAVRILRIKKRLRECLLARGYAME